MKTPLSTFLACLAIISLTACSSVTVTTDYDHAATFTRYKTYSLEPPAQGQTLSPSSEAALRDSLRAEMGARGIREVARGSGDLAVARHVFLQEKVSVQQYGAWGYGYHGGWPYGGGYYGMWHGAPMAYTDVQQYTVGTMILDFVDRRSNKVVFRGTGKAVVGGPDSNAAKVREAVTKIVADFPTAPKP